MRPQENPIISEIRVLIEEYEQFLSEKASGTQATEEQWDVIADLTSHDLQRDFAYRAREAGWSLEEVTSYLGGVNEQGGSYATNHSSLYPGQ